ncbi:CDP-glycerol glycerophosphotransferase family protein [Brachybacterium squillarum]|uniref:CDP-glycerol glycerophosphotransferase family protein n=1 Tax=Brachybacterium squillarum TaxID=661979 RepID=UPI0002FB5DC8|nr:CDP-glycerol glycerophosphotransferase family protein [Brachybacterium squillarum]
MAARGNGLQRRLRSAGGQVLRRLHLLPGGQPDGLGDDDKLRDAALDGEVIVYFPDTTDSLYQLRTWYGPLQELHGTQGVTVVCMDSRTAAAIRAETELPVITVARDATLDALILRSDIKLVLYVNYNPLNTAPLRTRSAVHVSLLHGDSDKGVSVSNQVKAYDYSFVAGQAAIDRYERRVLLFDAAERCIPVGRPTLDTGEPRPGPGPLEGRRPVVLYAPTWEGGQASVAYSSLLTHADTLVASLLHEGIDVIYRPHPLTGVRTAAYGEADESLRRMLTERGQIVSDLPDIGDDFARADAMVCDVSAVASDWLATGRPLVVTRAQRGHGFYEAATDLLRLVPRLSMEEADQAGGLLMEQITHDPLRAQRRTLTEYYLGDTAPGASLQRFLQACQDLAARRDELWARVDDHEDRSTGHVSERIGPTREAEDRTIAIAAATGRDPSESEGSTPR